MVELHQPALFAHPRMQGKAWLRCRVAISRQVAVRQRHRPEVQDSGTEVEATGSTRGASRGAAAERVLGILPMPIDAQVLHGGRPTTGFRAGSHRSIGASHIGCGERALRSIATRYASNHQDFVTPSLLPNN